MPAAADRDMAEQLRDGVLNLALKLGRGVTKKGLPYVWMVDVRELVLSHPYLKLAGALLWRRLKPYAPQAVGGMTLAANPLTAAVLYEAWAEGVPLQGFLIRKQRKPDGLRKLVEGPDLPAGARVALLDDFINTGATQRAAFAALAPFRVQVVAVGAVLDAERAGNAWLRGRGVAVEPLFSLAELGITSAMTAPVEGAAWRWGGLNRGADTTPLATPAVTNTHVIAAGDTGLVLGLTHAGAEAWRFTTRPSRKGVHGCPLLAGHHAIFGAYDGFLYCLDTRDGALVWETQVARWIGSSPCLDPSSKKVFVGTEYGEAGGSLIACAAATGALLWETPLRALVHSSPCYDAARERVLVGCNHGVLHAVDAADGKLAWRYAAGGAIKAGPAVDADFAFVCSGDGFAHAVDAATGAARWRRRIGRRAYFRPLLAGDIVIAGGAAGRLLGLDRASGQVRWCATLGGAVVAGGTTLLDGRIAFGGADGCLYLLDAQSGRAEAIFRASGAIAAAPGVGAGLVLAPSRDGFLYAVKPPGHAA